MLYDGKYAACIGIKAGLFKSKEFNAKAGHFIKERVFIFLQPVQNKIHICILAYLYPGLQS
jgi:hypothetical protein